ncbi:MAG: hypothetical protein DLM64_10250 [Solirubrobacterales bacterium]|nr:MAG: hypothetical protein DLM64_10250 [Solirubrobacterales bacterium]
MPRSVVVALVMRTARGIPTEVRLDNADGMPRECAISFDNLRTVPKALLVDRIAVLSRSRLSEVCAALDFALGC